MHPVLAYLVENLRKINIEVFVQDITNPILGFPVAHVMLSGGKDYFSQIPINFYSSLVLGTKDQNERFSLLNERIKRKLSPNRLHEIILEGKWCSDVNQQELIDIIIE